MKKVIALVISCLITSLLYSQSGWTLEMCIKYALEHSLDVESSNISVKLAENNYTSSWMRFTPTISSSFDVEIHPHIESSPSIISDVVLFEGLSRLYNLKSVQKGVEISELEREKVKLELTTSITKVYLEILLYSEMIKAANQGYNTSLEQLSRCKLLVENGSSTEAELFDMEFQRASEEAQITNLNNSLNYSIVQLKETINFPLSDAFNINYFGIEEKLSSTIINHNIQDIYEKAQSLPHVQIAKLNITQKEYERRSVNGMVLPEVSLNMGYNIKNDFSSVGLSVRIPIFNRGNTLTSIKNANLHLENSKLEYQKVENILYRDILQTLDEGRFYYDEYLAAQAKERAASEVFKYAESKYNTGEISSTDYIINKNNLLQAQSEVIQCKYKYIFQLILIEYYCGNWKY